MPNYRLMSSRQRALGAYEAEDDAAAVLRGRLSARDQDLSDQETLQVERCDADGTWTLVSAWMPRPSL